MAFSGRTTRILLDGQDITDENVGTTIFNVAQGAIGEFQINHSTQDVAGEITSTGQVLVSTRSGTNQFHGNLFYNFQDNHAGFATFDNNNPPFQRNQFGGGVGGPIIKDKLFFFADAERLKQDQSTTSTLSSTLSSIKAAFPSIKTPFRSTYSTGRLDYNGPLGGHYFARLNYDVNASPSGSNYSLYVNRDNTWGIAGGADFSTGRFTHSFRGSYEKFHNLIGDNTAGNTGLYNPIPGLNINFGAAGLATGPNANAPQATLQSDKQIRYDGSYTAGRHNIRFGGSYNRLLGGGLASFFGLGPRAYLYAATLVPGLSASDPLNYGFRYLYVGNGQGFFSEKPQFGYPGGGQSDNRMAAYVSDSWKITPSFTLTAGVRYSRDTLRANQDLGSIPCSAVDPAIGYTPCTGSANLLDQFGAGLGNRVNQPNMNFGPQIGFTWSPGGSTKTVLRAGYGIYYDSNIWNNILFDRENRLAKGLFNQYQFVDTTTGNPQVIFPGGVVVTTSPNGTPLTALAKQPLSQSGPQILALQRAYQTAVAAAGASSNPAYVGNTLNIPSSFYAPNYVSPYSQQLNFGIQRELGKGMVLSVDYVHSAILKIQQSVDMNHVGAARYLNTAAAQFAIAQTAAGYGCTATTSVAQIQCVISNGGSINDLEAAGLDSGNNLLGGNSVRYAPQPLAGHLDPNTSAAFGGANPNLGVGLFNTPSGKSAYDALNVKFQQQKSHPAPGILSSNFQAAYTYSHSTTTSKGGSNAFFTNSAWNQDAPSQYMGPSDLDQRHQISFGGSATLKYGPVIGLIGHFRSAPAGNLTLDNTVGGDIFQTDVDGDGQAGDLAPGTNPGAFMRNVGPGGLKQFIANYNSTQAGHITPAGQALVNAGLATTSQLAALNAVQQPIYSPAGAVFANSWFRSIDASFGYPIRIRKISEAFSLTPSVAMYNVANFSNWGGTTGTLLNVANAGAAGADSATYVNGENPYLKTKDQFRTQRGAGTYDQGGLRSTEFQLKLTF